MKTLDLNQYRHKSAVKTLENSVHGVGSAVADLHGRLFQVLAKAIENVEAVNLVVNERQNAANVVFRTSSDQNKSGMTRFVEENHGTLSSESDSAIESVSALSDSIRGSLKVVRGALSLDKAVGTRLEHVILAMIELGTRPVRSPGNQTKQILGYCSRDIRDSVGLLDASVGSIEEAVDAIVAETGNRNAEATAGLEKTYFSGGDASNSNSAAQASVDDIFAEAMADFGGDSNSSDLGNDEAMPHGMMTDRASNLSSASVYSKHMESLSTMDGVVRRTTDNVLNAVSDLKELVSELNQIRQFLDSVITEIQLKESGLLNRAG